MRNCLSGKRCDGEEGGGREEEEEEEEEKEKKDFMTLLVFEFSKLALRWLSSAQYTYTVAYGLIIIT